MFRPKFYYGYYNIKDDTIFIQPHLKGIIKMRWFWHEKIHQYLYKIFGYKIGKYINLLWDLLDNSISSIPFYFKSFNSEEMKNFGGGGTTTVTSHTYYYYKIKFPHTSIDPSQSIIFYDAFGNILYTLPPNYQFMNYGEGVLSVPGSEQNSQVESVSTATYYVFYSTGDLVIDYEQAEFKIAKKIIKFPAQSIITATYEYITIFTPFRDVASVIDGKWDTQVQTEFFAEPPTGYNYAILDLGAIKNIQALDIVAGFYKPDNYRRFDINMNFSIKYSTDGTNYYDISDETHNFNLTGGQAKQFEEEDLGIGFQARYLKLIIEDVKKVDYGQVKDENGNIIREGLWVVAITEIAAYDDIYLKSEATLIPTTQLTAIVGPGDSGVNVTSTNQFTSSGTVYIDGSSAKSFTYTGKSATQFTGCTINSGVTGAIGDRVSQTIESDTTVYDDDGLLQQLKDRIYKVNKISNEYLYTQSQLDYVAKRYLREFYKNHSKVQVEVLYAPHLSVGNTVQLIDTYNNTSRNYFIEGIRDNNGFITLTLAYYPA